MLSLKMDNGQTKVLFVDVQLIIAIKPAGLLAVPGRGVDKQDCLSARLAALYGAVHIAHRLDQATSGLMVFARTLEALRHLHQQFRLGQVAKNYEAIVTGQLPPQQLDAQQGFCIDLPVMPDWPNRPKQKIDWSKDKSEGKYALTRGQVLSWDAKDGTSRVRLMPLTGRTHQLRVHLSAIGCAIVGDKLYGAEFSLTRPTQRAGLLLHATGLGFIHPATGQPLWFESNPDF